MSALKKSEHDNDLILRLFNISTISEKARLNFYKKISLSDIRIVNLLEEEPQQKIKAEINDFTNSSIEVTLEPHVIATFLLKIRKKLS